MTTLQLGPLHTRDSHWTSTKLNVVKHDTVNPRFKKVQNLAKLEKLTIHYGYIRATVVLSV